jgi:hypothetical protein
MMARTQITLSPDLHRRAREKAAQLGVSLAEYIRRLVARDLDTPKPLGDPSILFALGQSGGSDIAHQKDALLAEALAHGSGVSARRSPEDDG